MGIGIRLYPFVLGRPTMIKRDNHGKSIIVRSRLNLSNSVKLSPRQLRSVLKTFMELMFAS